MAYANESRRNALYFCAALLGVTATSAALAQDEGLRRCRTISEAAQRLACYDALAPQESSRADSRNVSPQDGAPLRPAERFGLEHKAPPQASRIESHIAGTFHGWGPNSEIRLANGQVWQVVDGSTMASVWENPRISIRRGTLGSFFLDIEGETRSARVRRVR